MSAFVHYLKKLIVLSLLPVFVLMNCYLTLHQVLESRAFLVFDSCERLRSTNVSSRLLDSLIRLSELSKLNISVIFISCLPWDRMVPAISATPVSTVLFPPYSEDEMRTLLVASLPQKPNLPSTALLVNKLLPQIWPECRVFDRLLPIFAQLYQSLCAPVLDGSVDSSQTAKLFLLAKPHFDAAVRVFSGKIASNDALEGAANIVESRDRAEVLPLPRIARLLLLASFFASHNPPRTDAMHFCESTLGRKRQRTSKTQQIKDFEQFQAGPKVFAWERWLAIYYAMLKQTCGEQPRICSEEIGQVSVLVAMDLVVSVGGDVRNPRYKSNISLATCEKLAKELNIDFAAHFHGA
jgi:origin recognition complex subunit 5